MKIKTLGTLAATMLISYTISNTELPQPVNNFVSKVDKGINENIKTSTTFASIGNVFGAYLVNEVTGMAETSKETKKAKTAKKTNITLKDYLKDDFSNFVDKRYNNLIKRPEFKETLEQLTTKKIPIFMFHKVGYRGDRYSVTPGEFEEILETLHENNYYALNFEEFVNNDLSNVPIGKNPYLITFDDAHPTQFQFKSGTNKPTDDCAVGIMEKFFNKHKDAGKGAVFYESAYGVDKEFIYMFGDKKTAKQKNDYLQNNEYNVGSHTTSHVNLAKVNYKKAREEIYTIDALLEMETTNDYLEESKKKRTRTLARPYGAKERNPQIKKLLRENYDTILNATGGRTHLAKTKNFDPYNISRIEASLEEVVYVITNNRQQFTQTPESKQFFEKVFNYNPEININPSEIEIKKLATKF